MVIHLLPMQQGRAPVLPGLGQLLQNSMLVVTTTPGATRARRHFGRTRHRQMAPATGTTAMAPTRAESVTPVFLISCAGVTARVLATTLEESSVLLRRHNARAFTRIVSNSLVANNLHGVGAIERYSDKLKD